MLNKIINGIFWATMAVMPGSAVCGLVLAYLNLGIKEGYTQEYAIGYFWVYLAIAIVYDAVMIATTKKTKEMAR